jgi:cytochrome b involved in lipid metabolism
MKKFAILILVIAGIITTVFFLQRENDPEVASTNTEQTTNQTPAPEATPATPTPETDPNVKTFTMEEVRKHGPESWDNGDSSPLCWMAIHDKVYEIPDNFVETHPGGHVIYEGCGTDATTFFETRPQGSGTPHSADARAILEKYYIGDLKK